MRRLRNTWIRLLIAHNRLCNWLWRRGLHRSRRYGALYGRGQLFDLRESLRD